MTRTLVFDTIKKTILLDQLAASEDKLDLLRSLLKDNPNLGMKDANAVIREQFGTGVAPPQFSKVKKEFEGDEKLEQKEVTYKKEEKKQKVIIEKTVEEKELQNNNDLESFFDGKEASQVKKEIKESSESTQVYSDDQEESENREPEVEEKKEQEPLPTHPIKLEVTIPHAETVHLAGSFNKWKVEDYPLKKSEGNLWVFDHELPEGEHFYKFVVNKKVWHIDQKREYFVDPTGISHKLLVSAS